MHCIMLTIPSEDIQAYYTKPFLPPTTLFQVDVFKNDDAILEKL